MPAHPEVARFFLQDAPILAVRVLQVLTVKFLLPELQPLAKPEDRPIPVLVPSLFSTICHALGSRPRRSPASCLCWQGCATASPLWAAQGVSYRSHISWAVFIKSRGIVSLAQVG